jgi:hypothetical protein
MRKAIQVVTLDSSTVEECKDNARKACLGGRSAVRGSDRLRELMVDQLVGQFGQAALSLYQTGSLQAYREARATANADPLRGDGGCDLPGLATDIKTSLMRSQRDLLAYNLLVRPRELHQGHTYILGLVRNPEWSGGSFRELREVGVVLIGWATAEMLASRLEMGGLFAGAHVIPAEELREMMPVRWQGVRCRVEEVVW